MAEVAKTAGIAKLIKVAKTAEIIEMMGVVKTAEITKMIEAVKTAQITKMTKLAKTADFSGTGSVQNLGIIRPSSPDKTGVTEVCKAGVPVSMIEPELPKCV